MLFVKIDICFATLCVILLASTLGKKKLGSCTPVVEPNDLPTVASHY
jgi:hypothetical protein